MPLHGEEVARQRVGDEEWVVRFGALAVTDHVWEFIAHKANESPSDEENLFWSSRLARFAEVSREDVPVPVLERVEDWVRRTMSGPKRR